MLKYIIEFLFCSAAFMALYKLLLEGRVAHAWARKYLVITMFVSLLIPSLELPLYPAEAIYLEIPVLSPPTDVASSEEAVPLAGDMTASASRDAVELHEADASASSHSFVDWMWVLVRAVWMIYLLITLLNLAHFAWRLYIIGKLRRHCELSVYELYTLAVSDRVREPFSFWRTIYVNRLFRGREFNQVIAHELSHIRHHHTAERLALELLRCVAWFNPFVWLASSALVEVHEWQADSDVLSEGYDVYEYRQLIFQQLYGYNPNIASGLSSQSSKKRFLMMTNFKKGKFSFLRLGAILPVVAVLVFAFGAVRAESELVITKSESSETLPTSMPTPAVQDEPEEITPITSDLPTTDTLTYNRQFTTATPTTANKEAASKNIILNKGTYVVGGYGFTKPSTSVTDEQRAAAENITFKVVSDTEIDVTNAHDLLFKSGRYTYTLTREQFTLKGKDASYTFRSDFGGPLFKSHMTLYFDEQHEYVHNIFMSGPLETKDKQVYLNVGPNGEVIFNGEKTTIEELREKHYIKFDTPAFQSDGTSVGTMEDVIKQKQNASVTPLPTLLPKDEGQSYNRKFTAHSTPVQDSDKDTPFVKMTDIIRLTVDDEYLHIKEGDDKTTKLSLAEITEDNFFPLMHNFIAKKASANPIEQKWANGKVWSYPASNAVIVVDAKKGAKVSSIRRVKELAYRAVVRLRVEVLKGQTKTVYGRLCEKDCEVLERAIPMNIIVTPEAEKILNISPRTDILYTVADQQPRFKGKEGKAAYKEFAEWANEYFKKNMNLQKLFEEPWASVFPLIIEKDGSITLDKDLTFEWYGYYTVSEFLTENICAAAPKWQPAKNNGKPVRMKLDMMFIRGKDGIKGVYSSTSIERLVTKFTKVQSAASVPRGVVVNPKQNVLDNDGPSCKTKITKVTLTDSETIVDLHVEFRPNWWVIINNHTTLMTPERIYPIQDVKGATMDMKYWMPKSGKATFQLIFPPIECKTDKITFGENSWLIEDIDLSNLQPLEECDATLPRLADGEYRPIGVIKKSSQDDGKELVAKVRELMPTIKVKGDRITVEGNHYKDFIKPSEYSYEILDDGRIYINGTGEGYNFPYEYSTLSTGANLLDLMFTSTIDNTQILGVMYSRDDWED